MFKTNSLVAAATATIVIQFKERASTSLVAIWNGMPLERELR